MKKWMVSHENIKFLEESGLLTKDVSETIENGAKEKKVDFLEYY